jgi:hypothetical protein
MRRRDDAVYNHDRYPDITAGGDHDYDCCTNDHTGPDNNDRAGT